MIQFFDEGRKGCAIVLAVLALGGCSTNLVERVIDARGGPLASYRKRVDAEVKSGMPGSWSWEVAYRVPESFRWTLDTHGDEQTLLFDGVSSRQRLGSVALPPLPADGAVRSQAHWFAFTSLDVLLDPRVRWRELPESALPEGASSGLSARFGETGPAYELFFDDRDLLVRARGPVAMVPIGAGQLDATFADYRDVDGWVLPFSGSYRLDGHALMRETVRGWQPDDPSLEGPSAFTGQ